MAVKAASLTTGTAGAAALKLPRATLALGVVERGQHWRAGDGKHKPDQKESQKSCHRIRNAECRRDGDQGQFAFPRSKGG